MGYLHAKNIVHKDLKSKNVFLEQGKVVITDFGLFSVNKLCHGNTYVIVVIVVVVNNTHDIVCLHVACFFDA